MSEEVILNALKAAGVSLDDSAITEDNVRRVTKSDLYDDGLYGGENSKQLREQLMEILGLPKRLSANSIPKALENLVTYDEYKSAVNKLMNNE